MNVTLSEEQTQLIGATARLAEALQCPPPATLPNTEDDPDAWNTLTQAGLVAMHLAEEQGGGGAHSSDVALVIEQFGRHASLVPVLGQGVLAPELARIGAAPHAFLNGVAEGSRRFTVALSSDLRRLARLGDDALAWDARGATHALCLTEDSRVAVVSLDRDAIVQADITRVLVSVEAAEPLDILGGTISRSDLERFDAFALAMVSADLLGVAHSAVEATANYVASRAQFGVPIGVFQAVQHLAADAKVLLEGTRSSVWFAAWAADELDSAEALLAARQAKAYASAAALEIVEAHTQLLGGIAITWEEHAHVRVRRVLLDRFTLGDEHVQRDAIADVRLGSA